jgi:hypothetical protein
MQRLFPILGLITAVAIGTPVPAMPQLAPAIALSVLPAPGVPRFDNAIALVAGMNGGGMMGGGVPGGGMMGGGVPGGGMMGGGVPGGGMMGGGTGTPNGVAGYGNPPAYSNAPVSTNDAQSYDSDGTGTEAGQAARSYHCVTRHGQCAVDASSGPLQHGASCGCLLGGPGKIQ